jgi:TolB protein
MGARFAFRTFTCRLEPVSGHGRSSGSASFALVPLPAIAIAAALLASLCLVILASPSRTHAAFPGKDGRILVSSDRDGNYEIWSMRPDGTGARSLTNNGDYNDDATLSPNGTKIAYRDSSGAGEADVFVMNPNGSGPVDLTNYPGYDAHPAWSPNGKKIAFTSNRSGTDQIYLMSATGNNVHPVKLSGLVQDNAVFTPDGKRIIFGGGNGDLYRMDVDGSHRRRLTDGPAYDEYPDISPNGSRIVFDRTINMGDSKVFKARVDGTHAKRLTSAPGSSFEPWFSPSGKKVVFSSNRDSPNYEAFVMKADGSKQHRVTSTTSSNYPSGWGISP